MKNRKIPNTGKLKRDPSLSRTKWNTLFLIELKESLSTAMSNSGKDRFSLAADISRTLGEDIPPSYLNNVVAPSRDDLIPKANFVRAVVDVTGDTTPLLIMTQGVSDFHVISDQEKLKLDLFRSKNRIAAEQEKQQQIITEINRIFAGKEVVQ